MIYLLYYSDVELGISARFGLRFVFYVTETDRCYGRVELDMNLPFHDCRIVVRIRLYSSDHLKQTYTG
jgi:hypothetical protein